LKSFVQARPGQFRLTDAIGEVDEQFTSDQVKLFGLNRKLAEVFGSVLGGLTGQKKDVELSWFNVVSLGEWIIGND